MSLLENCKFNYLDDKSLIFFNELNSIEPIDLDKSIYGLKDVCGIYFLFNLKNEVVYIGKSKSLLKRIKHHYDNDNIEFYNSTILCIESKFISIAERFFINKYLPKYNIDSLTHKIRSIKNIY